jgi:GT2 family glycosyltransferase
MGDQQVPDLAAIVVTPDNYATIRKTVGFLQRQTAKHRLEIVIVAPSSSTLDLNGSDLEEFAYFQIVELGTIGSLAQAYAAGIRQARAPIVALTEDHSFPDPYWAEVLIEAHRNPWAVVGPVVRNGNPNSLVSWADFYIAYGRWSDPTFGGIIDHLPGHNSSYKRDILLKYGSELEAMLEAESVLHWDLRAKGYQLYLEPAAKIAHLNFALLSSWLPIQYHAGRQFAAIRAQAWSFPHRLLFTGAAPLIPLVRLWRIQKQIRRSGQPRGLLYRVLPALMLGLGLDGLGQMVGYGLGIGGSIQKVAKYEFHREQHIKQPA